MKKMNLTAAALGAAMLMGALPTYGDLNFPMLSYRTGPFGGNGAEFADGYADYFTLLNERDGGIGGVLTKTTECETQYNTQKGVECYESTKNDNPLVYQPLSTGITYQLIPKATVDEIPVLSAGYGRTSAVNGTIFPYVFNFPGNYWDAASVIVKHMLAEENGDLKGKKVKLLYFNGAYGKEPIPTLEKLAEKHGYEFSAVPIDYPGQEQKSQWLEVRRDRPDYVLLWGWGVMNQVAIKEASNIRFPMDHFIGVWWSGSENDVLPVGGGANGYKAVTFHGVGSDYPLYADIQKHVVDTGKAAGDGSNLGTALYSRGMYSALLAAEAARTAQEMTGNKNITSKEMRDGLENLKIDEARMVELGLPNFGPEINISCANHGGPGVAAIQQWDAGAGKWNLITEYVASDRDVIDPLIKADSEAYAAENNITPRDCN